jgi:hypothetical protein
VCSSDLFHDPETFTGSQDGQVAGVVRGEVGTLKYAIQGNVLTCPQVWLDAEAALLGTPGDLSQKMMAAMQAAKAEGGDGRCSCNAQSPWSCGCVTAGTKKSAHVAFVIVARPGDALGDCTAALGCATGAYWLDLEIPGVVSDPIDPVVKLQAAYDTWRAGLAGVPDQLHSKLVQSADSLMADGLSTAAVEIELLDVDGAPVGHGGHTVQAISQSTGAHFATPLAAIDHGDGTYTLPFVAGGQAGSEAWRIVVNDGVRDIPLAPLVTLDVAPASSLHAGFHAVSAASGATVPFTLDFGAGCADGEYRLLGTLLGTQPGTPFAGLVLPLNVDGFTRRGVTWANHGPFHDTHARLDSGGRATASIDFSPAWLGQVVGRRFDFAAIVPWPAPAVSRADGFDVVP